MPAETAKTLVQHGFLRSRDRALRVAGYSVTRLTWNQLDDEPEQVSADLRVLLGIER